MSKQNIQHEMASELISKPEYQYFKSQLLKLHRADPKPMMLNDNMLARMYAFESGTLEFFRYVESLAESDGNTDLAALMKPFEHYGENEEQKPEN